MDEPDWRTETAAAPPPVGPPGSDDTKAKVQKDETKVEAEEKARKDAQK